MTRCGGLALAVCGLLVATAPGARAGGLQAPRSIDPILSVEGRGVLDFGAPCAALDPRIVALHEDALARDFASGSAFASLRVDGTDHRLEQRSITREWPAIGDPEVAAGRIPGSRSELAALSLSALMPGAGELYVGEKSGIAFAVAEVAGWIGFTMFRSDARDLRSESEHFAGTPVDSASAWSFQRWSTATGGDAASLVALYAGDREAFWNAIAQDASFAAGWADVTAHDQYASLRVRANDKQFDANRIGAFLWINHLISAADALRAARLHNIPLTSTLGLKVGGKFRNGQPSLRAQLVRRF